MSEGPPSHAQRSAEKGRWSSLRRQRIGEVDPGGGRSRRERMFTPGGDACSRYRP